MRSPMKCGVKKRRAFTLIELLVVIAIIGILAAIIIVLLNSARRRAQDAQVKSDVTSLSQALEIVKVDRNLVPSGGYQPINGTNANDSNTDRWREDGGIADPFKKLINTRPIHPIAGQVYWISVTSATDYGLVAKLNPTNTYFCNTNGTTRTQTNMATDADARADCAP